MTQYSPPRQNTIRSRKLKAPIGFASLSILGLLLFVTGHRAGISTLDFGAEASLISLPPWPVESSQAGIFTLFALLVLTAVSIMLSLRYKTTPLWLIVVFGVIFFFGFITWAGAGASIPVAGLLVGGLALATPLIFGALGGVISERVGVVNVAIEGQFLAGAFVSALVASLTGNLALGLITAMVAGVLVSFVLAVFALKYLVDQVIVGIVLNVLVTGLTSFLYSDVLIRDAATLNAPPRFDRIDIPLLSSIPVLGPLFFQQTIIGYIMYAAVGVITWALFRTRWGLRLRAVGEHPKAAATVGIDVNRTRLWNVALAGAIAGLGGAFFTLGAVGSFQKEMTAGAGFIALAAVIFGRWNPVLATLAALLFGLASNLQNVLGAIGSPVPSEFMLMLPYAVTIIAVAGLVGKVRGPAASGIPYANS